MKQISKWFIRAMEGVTAIMMAAMFLTFILQITIRYTGHSQWIAENLPFLESSHFGWTLEFCLALWVWIIFFGNSFIVREQDHVTFDLLYMHVNPKLRKWFAIITSILVCVGLLWSLEPTWGKFYFLRLKKTASLSALFGDWIRMRHIYLVYILFLVIVALRYAWRALSIFRLGPEADRIPKQEELKKQPDTSNGTDAS